MKMKPILTIGYRFLVIFTSYLMFILINGHLSFVIASEKSKSRSFVVMDASNGQILYAKNPYLKCPPASTVKLMTAIIAMENLDMGSTVTVSRKASSVSPHKANLKEGDRISVEKLLYAALVGSANDAAVALAEAAAGSEKKFVRLMNKKAKEIGAKNTKFVNASGLPASGQYTTAYDLSIIMSYALNYPKLQEIIGTRVTQIYTETGDSIFIKNTNRLLWVDEDLLGGKTGYTRNAKHCFVCVAERGGDKVVVAILGTPSREELWRETKMLLNKGFEIIGNNEKPVIYYTKTNYNLKVKHKISLKKKNDRRLIVKKGSKKVKSKLAAKKSKTKSLAKRKARAKTLTKKKQEQKKNYNVANTRKGNGTKG